LDRQSVTKEKAGVSITWRVGTFNAVATRPRSKGHLV
jgi:hypothetical protein